MTAQAPSRWATDADVLANLLTRIRTWKPLDSEALLDDVASALDDVPPREEEAEEIAERLRGHLVQLVSIAVAGAADRDSRYAGALVKRARALRAVGMSGDNLRAVLHLRQLGWVTSELLDQLVALKSIKEAA
jgi:Family of unknown function (DUF6415)